MQLKSCSLKSQVYKSICNDTFLRRSRLDFRLCNELRSLLRGCPCKNRQVDFRPKTEFLQIFRVRQLVHMINKNGNNLAFNAIFQHFWRQFQRTVQNRLNRSVSSQI